MATGKLAQVEQDAMRINAKRFRDQEEELQYASLKDQPVENKTPEEVLAEVQSEVVVTPDQNKVELVSDENVKRAKESMDAAEASGEADNTTPQTNKVEDEKSSTKKGVK